MMDRGSLRDYKSRNKSLQNIQIFNRKSQSIEITRIIQLTLMCRSSVCFRSLIVYMKPSQSVS